MNVRSSCFFLRLAGPVGVPLKITTKVKDRPRNFPWEFSTFCLLRSSLQVLIDRRFKSCFKGWIFAKTGPRGNTKIIVCIVFQDQLHQLCVFNGFKHGHLREAGIEICPYIGYKRVYNFAILGLV